MSFHLDIVTPEGKVFEDAVDSLFANGLEGGFEVFTNHEPILAALKDGDLRVRINGKESTFQCGSGILEVKPDHQVLVLVDSSMTK